MTVRNAIQRIMEMQPSQYDDATMLEWLSQLDGQIWDDVLRHYDGYASAPAAYTEEDLDKELLVGHPHEAVYQTWLSAMIDYHNGEWERYNNTMMMHNAQLQAFYNSVARKGVRVGGAYIEI